MYGLERRVTHCNSKPVIAGHTDDIGGLVHVTVREVGVADTKLGAAGSGGGPASHAVHVACTQDAE